MPQLENHKESAPYAHYVDRFGKMDPAEASARCGVPYDAERCVFTVRLLGVDYEVKWPAFAISAGEGSAFALGSIPAQVLIMRFLLEGRRSEGSGAFLSYREMPWGEVYLKPFTGRCLARAAFAFGTRLDAFRDAMARTAAIPVKGGDAAYQIEVMPGYAVRLIVWEGDDEFPPSSQMLFSDNFPLGFSAEDRTVVGDIVISDIKGRMAR